MPGTGPRQRAAIALSFGVQAILIAGALALPAELSSTTGVSAAAPAPAPMMLLPVVSPLSSGMPFQAALSVTVKVGEAESTWTGQSGPSVLLTAPGPDVTATVTVTVPDAYPVRSLSFSLSDVAPRSAQASGSWGTHRALLSVPGPVGAGTQTFTLHLGSLGPQSGEDIVMTTTPLGAPGMASGVIAEIVTS